MTSRTLSTPTAIDPFEDHLTLCFVLNILCGRKLEHILPPAGYDPSDVMLLAFEALGVTGFLEHLVPLGKYAVDALSAMTDVHGFPLFTPVEVYLVEQSIQFYHHLCRTNGTAIDIKNIQVHTFQEFRTSVFDPTTPILPWGRVTSSPVTSNDSEVKEWKKNVKPSKSDYKEFKDGTFWPITREDYLQVMSAHNLDHMIDPDVRLNPPNKELYDLQANWMYNLMSNIMTEPMAKSIVQSYRDTKDIPAIWAEIDEYHSTSTACESRMTQISTFLTSIRFAQTTWKGKQRDRILNFQRLFNLYNEISPLDARFSDRQGVMFLDQAALGVPNLENVKSNDETSRKASKNYTPLKFQEYIILMTHAAEKHDGGLMNVGDPRNKSRSVNMSEIIFDDHVDSPQGNQVYDIEMHAFELGTGSIDINAHNASNARGPMPPHTRQARMDLTTWKSLTPKDQSAWDQVSDDGKIKILNYAVKKAEKASGMADPLSINQHDTYSGMTFDEEVNSGNATLEMNVTKRGAIKNPEPDVSSHPANRSKLNPNASVFHASSEDGKKVSFQKKTDSKGLDVRTMMSVTQGTPKTESEKTVRQITSLELLLPGNKEDDRNSEFPRSSTSQISAFKTEIVPNRVVEIYSHKRHVPGSDRKRKTSRTDPLPNMDPFPVRDYGHSDAPLSSTNAGRTGNSTPRDMQQFGIGSTRLIDQARDLDPRNTPEEFLQAASFTRETWLQRTNDGTTQKVNPERETNMSKPAPYGRFSGAHMNGLPKDVPLKNRIGYDPEQGKFVDTRKNYKTDGDFFKTTETVADPDSALNKLRARYQERHDHSNKAKSKSKEGQAPDKPPSPVPQGPSKHESALKELEDEKKVESTRAELEHIRRVNAIKKSELETASIKAETERTAALIKLSENLSMVKWYTMLLGDDFNTDFREYTKEALDEELIATDGQISEIVHLEPKIAQMLYDCNNHAFNWGIATHALCQEKSNQNLLERLKRNRGEVEEFFQEIDKNTSSPNGKGSFSIRTTSSEDLQEAIRLSQNKHDNDKDPQSYMHDNLRISELDLNDHDAMAEIDRKVSLMREMDQATRVPVDVYHDQDKKVVAQIPELEVGEYLVRRQDGLYRCCHGSDGKHTYFKYEPEKISDRPFDTNPQVTDTEQTLVASRHGFTGPSIEQGQEEDFPSDTNDSITAIIIEGNRPEPIATSFDADKEEAEINSRPQSSGSSSSAVLVTRDEPQETRIITLNNGTSAPVPAPTTSYINAALRPPTGISTQRAASRSPVNSPAPLNSPREVNMTTRGEPYSTTPTEAQNQQQWTGAYQEEMSNTRTFYADANDAYHHGEITGPYRTAASELEAWNDVQNRVRKKNNKGKKSSPKRRQDFRRGGAK